MGDIEWAVRSLGLALVNDTTLWIMGFIFVLVIFNIILEVFNENSK